MGEPAVPDVKDRAEAAAIANDVLERIRNDEAVEPTYRGMWLLASTLTWWIRQRVAPNLEQLAEKMFDAAEIEGYNVRGGELRRWTSLDQQTRDQWRKAAQVAHREIMRERP